MDWNNDGKKDLLTGENPGTIRIYLNTGTDANPIFSGFNYLQVGGSNFDAGSYSWIHVADWDSDGLLDVQCGESNGRIHLLINEGTPGSPLFNSSSFIQNGGSTLDVGSRSSPTVVDWNRDGKKDLISGNSGGNILYFENIGTDTAPVFNGSVTLKVGPQTLDVGYDSHPDVADWNNDGVMDIITGEFYGTVLFFQALGPLSSFDHQIPENTGASIDLMLNAGLDNGDRNYLMLGTVTGTEPGFPLPGGYATMPLNWDVFTDLVVLQINGSIFSNFMGTLNGSGKAYAQLNAPPVPGFAGISMHYAYALNDPWDYVSNPVVIDIVP